MSGLSPLSTTDIIDGILRREGSTYTDHPADRGGPTKFGITLATLQRHKPGATAVTVRDLTEEEARQIYVSDYIEAPGFDLVTDPALRTLLVDYGVTSGTVRAVKALQVAVGATPDGIYGPSTRALLAGMGHTVVYASVLRQYFQHFANVVVRNPSQIVFLRGWVNRACEFVR